MLAVTQHHTIPDSILERTTIDPPDYCDLFTVATRGAADGSPEAWARAAIEAAGLGGQFIWRVVLRLRLRAADDRVGGWAVGGRGDDWIRLEASSRTMTAHLVGLVGDDQLSIATLIRYHHATARLFWPRLAPVHRALMPGLLRATVSIQAKTTRP